MMGWQSDWLYQRVFQEVALLWDRIQREGAEGRWGAAPDALRVEERASAKWTHPSGTGAIRRVWIYNAGGPQLLSEPAPEYHAGERRESFWQFGLVWFHVAE